MSRKATKPVRTDAGKTPAHWGGNPKPEALDPTPMEIPASCQTPTPLNEIIARFVQQEVNERENQGVESWEEADDFEEDEHMLLDFSPYELKEIPPLEEGTAEALDPAPMAAQPPNAPDAGGTPQLNPEGASEASEG